MKKTLDTDITEAVPFLQDFTEYIENHFMDELVDSLEAHVLANEVEGLELKADNGTVIVDKSNGKLVRGNYWRIDRTHLLADLMIRLKVGISEDGHIPHYHVHNFTLSAVFTLDHGISMDKVKDVGDSIYHERRGCKLSRYLIPVLSYSDMEILTQGTIKSYLKKDKLVDYDPSLADELPKAMGLEVMDLCLYSMDDTESIMFMKEGYIQVHPSSALSDENYEVVHVPANTIVVNSSCQSNLSCASKSVCHECCHYEWHSMFYELQELHCSDLSLLKHTNASDETKPMQKDLEWVEKQARYFSVAALLPETVIRPLVHKLWAESTNHKNLNAGERFAYIINILNRDKLIPKYLTKMRLVGLGMVAAKGACNYVDEHKIASFAFNPDNLRSNETFVISRAQFSKLYEQDRHLQSMIGTRKFVYADGHVCINDPAYVQVVDNKMLLTEWARGHVDECCLRFKKEYGRQYASGYRLGLLHSDMAYNEAYIMIHALDISKMDPAELESKNLEYLENFPRTPNAALKMLIKDRCKTQRDFSVRSGLSDSTVSRMCSEKNFKYTIEQVARIVIGLSLPPALSAMFMELVGFNRSAMLQHYRYQCIIDCMFMDDIETITKTHHDLFS